MIRITQAIAEMRDAAARARRPDPVIYTDVHSALVLSRLIERDLEGPIAAAVPPGEFMFDGVKIKVYREPDAAWHNHFGALAEAFGETI